MHGAFLIAGNTVLVNLCWNVVYVGKGVQPISERKNCRGGGSTPVWAHLCEQPPERARLSPALPEPLRLLPSAHPCQGLNFTVKLRCGYSCCHHFSSLPVFECIDSCLFSTFKFLFYYNRPHILFYKLSCSKSLITQHSNFLLYLFPLFKILLPGGENPFSIFSNGTFSYFIMIVIYCSFSLTKFRCF